MTGKKQKQELTFRDQEIAILIVPKEAALTVCKAYVYSVPTVIP